MSKGQQVFHFHGPSTVNVNPPANNQFAEPYTEPITIKLTKSQKAHLQRDAKQAGYLNFSIYIRDMILLGLKIRPHLNKTVHDLIRE